MHTITLQDYDIKIGDFRALLHRLLSERNYTKIAVLVDENTRTHCLPTVAEVLHDFNYFVIEIPSGESHKNIQTCTEIWRQMMDNNADRHSLTLNLGGGVIGDMGGFCASTFKRGMDFLQMPTTLLSQVDASVGGKLGIGFNHVKNSIGVFNNPQTVLIDAAFLQSLSEREIRSGFAEIIKHALIADAEHWQKIRQIQDLKTVDWTAFLLPSLKIKQAVVEADPFEKGMRKALNFGHTVGHALESHALESESSLLHGEAVAAGMIAEAYLSVGNAGLSQEEFTEIKDFITRIYQPAPVAESNFSELIHLMRKDKKNAGSEINFTFLEKIGKAKINGSAEISEIEASLKSISSDS